MSNLSRPVFVERDPDILTQENVEKYETIVDKTLFPAQPERLMIDVMTYTEALLRQAVQETGEQNLVAYARDAALDQLGNNVGVQRLAAQPASCTVKITLTEALPYAHETAAGLKLQTIDNLFEFYTSESCFFNANETEATCEATCTTTGTDANGYLPGYLKLAEAVDNIKEVTNITETSLGAAEEDDDTFRERIPKAMEAFSCAGPMEAYRYWAQSAHQSVVDVSVITPSPGVVQIFPLTSSGAPSEKLLKLIAEAVDDQKRRPLTDKVEVLAPKAVHFTISAQVSIYGGSDRDSILAAINQKISEYKQNLAKKMGKDVVPSQIIALLQVDGVYSVTIASPDLLIIDSQSYPVLDSWEVNIGSVIYD